MFRAQTKAFCLVTGHSRGRRSRPERRPGHRQRPAVSAGLAHSAARSRPAWQVHRARAALRGEVGVTVSTASAARVTCLLRPPCAMPCEAAAAQAVAGSQMLLLDPAAGITDTSPCK